MLTWAKNQFTHSVGTALNNVGWRWLFASNFPRKTATFCIYKGVYPYMPSLLHHFSCMLMSLMMMMTMMVAMVTVVMAMVVYFLFPFSYFHQVVLVFPVRVLKTFRLFVSLILSEAYKKKWVCRDFTGILPVHWRIRFKNNKNEKIFSLSV